MSDLSRADKMLLKLGYIKDVENMCYTSYCKADRNEKIFVDYVMRNITKYNEHGNVITPSADELSAAWEKVAEHRKDELTMDNEKSLKFDSKKEDTTIRDSGERTEYATGAVRDCKEGKGRCDLMPLDVASNIMEDYVLEQINWFKNRSDVTFLIDAIKWSCRGEVFDSIPDMLLNVSKHFEAGAKKYGEYNWQKGIPVHSYIDSAVRHYLKYRDGWEDEPHDRAFAWNIMCCIWTIQHHPELDDYTDKKNENRCEGESNE